MALRLVSSSLARVAIKSNPLAATFATGTVKWFDVKKGFGFLTPDDGSGDIFVHHTAIQSDGFRSLADGEAIEYETEEDDTGRLRASVVTGPNGGPVQGRPRQPYGGGFGGGGFGGGFGDDQQQQSSGGFDTEHSFGAEDDDMWKPKSG